MNSINNPYNNQNKIKPTQSNMENFQQQTSNNIHNILHNNQEPLQLSENEKQKILQHGDYTTKEILKNYPQLLPTHKIQIDDFEFYLVPKIENLPDKRLFFVNKNNTIEPRMLRFSWSGKKWHSFPGYDSRSPSRYSKWDTLWNFDYESGVNADTRIIQALESIRSSNAYIPWNFTRNLRDMGFLSHNYETQEWLQEFEKISISDKQTSLWQTPSLLVLRKFLNEQLPKDKMIEFHNNPKYWMRRIFESINLNPKMFDSFLQNRKEFSKSDIEYSFPKWTQYRKISKKNDEIQKYEFEVGEYNNQKIIAKICYELEKPKFCWIESLEIKNSPITSYGIQKHRISGGIFTTKPIEYWSQIPNFIRNDIQKKNPNIEYYSNDYVSIVEYLQTNPFIIAFKDLQKTHPHIFSD